MKNIFNKNLPKRVIKTTIYLILIILLLIVAIQKFSRNEMSFLGYKIFRVVSSSMVPEYNINDVLLVKEKEAKEIRKGDNIVYLGNIKDDIKAPITHKVVDIKEDVDGNLIFHTKGIANTIEDPIVKEEQIYGVVISKMHLISLISALINNMYGFLLLIIVPLVILIYKNIRELISMSKENTNER